MDIVYHENLTTISDGIFLGPRKISTKMTGLDILIHNNFLAFENILFYCKFKFKVTTGISLRNEIYAPYCF